MGYLCDYCGDQRSMVYCRSDAACLCLSCDRNVHSANILSKRHSRTLICERCHSQPALVRCAEERVSLCQNCDWMGHGASTSSSTHKRQTISCYSGCPSAAELSSIWSSILDSPTGGESACEQEMGLMSINENSSGNDPGPSENASCSVGVNSGTSMAKASVWPSSSSVPEINAASQVLDLPDESDNATFPKLSFPGMKGSELCANDDLYADLDMDEVDLNFENYEELFGVALNNSEELFENGGIDSLFGATEMSGADSNCQSAAAVEGSVGRVNAMPACSNAASADSVMSTKTEPLLCFTRQQSSVSFSGPNGETTAGDYQDCGASSMLLMGEPPWCPPSQDNSLQSANRNDAVMRYKEKKKMRKFDKRVRYASRKARADVRKRVKGRFVKAGDAYDYDPLTQTRSC
ncbi:zinc finger protein CONSTANS-LIKE 9-like [Humulus lupulus]|uniref:zinc finger protein CONSTANS-LIKE 9-like n=1 Tax=Humulus lupulus TaxID=3486 RepID=UPI002B4149D3|nr:zinc finger protein CONSTANS-LIKE 9-like [Humulus lupulus]XP_062107103.1 zinc finger protein CONSTANS-LIKE 9-like [Humulus lupulus]